MPTTEAVSSAVSPYSSVLVSLWVSRDALSGQPSDTCLPHQLAYWFDYGINFVGGEIAWRLPIACQVIFAIIVVVLVFGLPDSPRDLFNKGRHDDAVKVLCDVFDKEPDHPSIKKEKAEILHALSLEGESQKSWLHIFQQDEVQTGKRVLLAYGMQFMNQVGGINLVV